MSEPKAWSVEQVASFLEKLELNALVANFRLNAVDGSDLLALSDEELKSELGCTTLQIKKIRKNLSAAGGGASPAAATVAATAASPPSIASAPRLDPTPAPTTAAASTPPIASAPPLDATPATAAAAASAPPTASAPPLADAPAAAASAPPAAAAPGGGYPPIGFAAAFPGPDAPPPAMGAPPPGYPAYPPAGGGAAPTHPGYGGYAAAGVPPPSSSAYGVGPGGAAAYGYGAGVAPASGMQAQMGGNPAAGQMASQAQGYEVAIRNLSEAAAMLEKAAGQLKQGQMMSGVGMMTSAMRGPQIHAGPGLMGRGPRMGPGPGRVHVGPARQSPVMMLIQNGSLKKVDEVVKQAAMKVEVAQQAVPGGIPSINPATVKKGKAGMFTNLLIGGVAAEAVMMSQFSSSKAEVEAMLMQVQQALHWLKPKAQQAQMAGQQAGGAAGYGAGGMSAGYGADTSSINYAMGGASIY